jgi:hypothetical protein
VSKLHCRGSLLLAKKPSEVHGVETLIVGLLTSAALMRNGEDSLKAKNKED